MASLGFLRYAVKDVFRNRRRTLTAIVGVLLTVTFVSGTFIAIDSSARATLDAYLAFLQGDFSYYTSTGNASGARAAVAGVPGVVDASVRQYVPVTEIGSDRVQYNASVSVNGIDPDHLPASLRGVAVTGSLALPRGSVALTSQVASDLGLRVGGDVFLIYRYYNLSTNQTDVTLLNLTVSALVSSPIRPFVAYAASQPLYFYGEAFVNLADVDWVQAQLNVPYRTQGAQGEVWIDRERFIDPYNLDASRQSLARFQRSLDNALAAYGGFSSSNLLNALQGFQSTLAVQRVQYLFLSGPVIFLGLYLGAVGVDLGHAERRRELAIFKTRGATPRQVLGLLVLEAVVGGVAAGVLGLLAGIGLSRILLGVVTPASSTTRYTDLLISSDTVITTVVLGTVFMLLASHRSARRTARLVPVESLRHYAPGETKLEYRPTVDIILVALAVASFGIVLWMRSGAANLFVFLLGIIFFLLLPFSPIFLIIGLTRLATRSSGKVYEWASRLLRPLAKNLYHVINRNVARNPRRSSNICVIIALGVAFGLFTLTLFGSQQAWEERRLRAAVGADLSAYANPGDTGFGANLSGVLGITGISRLVQTNARPPYYPASTWAVDAPSLFAVARPDPWYFDAGGADVAAAVLARQGSVLITRAYADAAFIQVGDVIALSVQYYNATSGSFDTISRDVTVGGFVRSMPGTDEYTFTPPANIFGSPATLAPFLVTTPNVSLVSSVRYLASLAPGANLTAVRAAVEGLGGSDVRLYSEELARLNNDPFRRAFLGFLVLEIAFAAVILTVGLALVAFAAVLERKVEFAGIVARGASGRQAGVLLIGEAAAILIIGLIVGAAVGLLSSWLMTMIFLVGPPGQPEPLVPFLFTLPPEGALFVVGAPLAMIAAVGVVAWRIARMDVARALRIRGG